MQIKKKTEKRIAIVALIIGSILGPLLLVPQITNSLNISRELSQGNINIPFALVPTGPFPNHLLPCQVALYVNEYYTDGSVDTNVPLGSVQFYPQVNSFVKNPSNGKQVSNFIFQPKIICNLNTGITQAQVSGTYQIYNTIYYTVNAIQNTVAISKPIQTIGTVNITPNTWINLGSSYTVSPTQIISSIPSGITNVGFASYIFPALNFYIPAAAQHSSWNGHVESSQIGLTLVGSSVTTTNPPPQPTQQTSFPIQAGITYKITYADGTYQQGTSANVQSILLSKLDFFKQDANHNQVPITAINFKILLADSHNQGFQITKALVNIVGKVDIGDHLPITLSDNDISVSQITDGSGGLYNVDVDPRKIESDISAKIGPAQGNPQQATISFAVDSNTAGGGITAYRSGIQYHGVINGLTWTFDSLYGVLGATQHSTGDANGGLCQSPSIQVGGSINPNGGSPSSGQSFGCVDTTPFCTAHPTDPSCQSTNGDNSGLLGSNLPPTFSNGISGICTDTQDPSGCFNELLTSAGNLTSAPNLLIYALIGIGLFIIILIAAVSAARRN